MQFTIFPKRISGAGAGMLMLPLMLLTSSCDQSRQTKNEGDSTRPTKPSVAQLSSHGQDTAPRPMTSPPHPSAAAGEDETLLAQARPAQTAATTSKAATPGNRSAAPSVTKAAKRDKPATARSSAPTELDAEANSSESGSIAAPAVGIRLAPDVRLPVAAIPIDFTISPVAEEARQQIIKDYYREVAAAVNSPAVAAAGEPVNPVTGHPTSVAGNGGVSASPTTVQDSDPTQMGGNAEEVAGHTPDLAAGEVIEDAGEGPTVVVTNRPEVEAARQRADWRFKALFGDAAYNRMVMQSLMESRLPDHAASNSDSGNRRPLTDGD